MLMADGNDLMQEEQRRVEQGLPPPLHPSAHPGLKKKAPPNAPMHTHRRSSGGGKSKGGRPQRRSSGSTRANGDEDDGEDEDGAAEYEEDESRLLCVCQQPYSADSAMVSCDTCGEWFHLRCVGLTQARFLTLSHALL